MPTVTFQYDLIEDKAEVQRVLSSLDLALCLDSYFNAIRTKLKYGDLTEQEDAIWEEARDILSRIMEEYNINLYTLLE